MICPLLLLGIFANSQGDVIFEKEATDCRRERCAWWVDEEGACAVWCLGRINEKLLKGD